MHDRTNSFAENSFATSEPRKHEHCPWVNKYLDLADTALREKQREDQDQAA